MGKKSVRVRRVATPDHLTDDIKEQLNSLDKELFEGSPVFPKHGSYWWLVYYGDDVVGFGGLTYYPELKSAFLSRVGVLPIARGLGIQKKLIKARERQAVKDGYDRIISYTSRDNVVSANNLIACGYKLYTPKWDWGIKWGFYLEKKI